MANKILIVDDELDVLKILSIRLRYEGYEVICATSGNEAIELTYKENPEIILLDIMMPGIDGFEVKAQLNKDPIMASIPVIFLSADITVESKLGGFSLGANDYITKPFNPDELLARINSALVKKHYYEKLSMTDGLTGLYNYSYFKQQLSYFFNLAKRYSKTFSLIVIDINDLKTINDSYGHSVGDCVLENFSSIASNCIRTSDILSRYGGDEFAIILPEIDLNNAKNVMNKIKMSVCDSVVSIPGLDKKVCFSISAGVAEFDAAYENETEFFNYADNKMYEDKAKKL